MSTRKKRSARRRKAGAHEVEAAARQALVALTRYEQLGLDCDSGGGESEGNHCPEVETAGGECQWCELYRAADALSLALRGKPLVPFSKRCGLNALERGR